MTFEGPAPGIPDATIRQVSHLPDSLPGAGPAGLYVQAVEDQLLIVMPGVARYLVSDGTRIDVAPEPDADEGAVAIYLFGAARAALIHQRGELPLHAATLSPPDKDFAVALCGASGAGKSTLAAELSRRGWALLADDATRVSVEPGSLPLQPTAWPSLDGIKLWRDACEARRLDVSALEPVRQGMDKFWLPVARRDTPVRLGAVVELVQAGMADLSAVQGGARLDLLSRHTFRPRQIRPLGRLAQHMKAVMAIAGQTDVRLLHGARSSPVSTLADVLEAAFR